MLGHVESMSRTTLLALFGLAFLVPVVLTSVQIYQKRVAPETLNCDTLTTTLEGIDDRSTVPRNSILVLGDTPLRHWTHPLLSVGRNEVVVRSPQGLQTHLIGQCFQRTVAFYHPLVTVLFLGREEVENSVLDALNTLDERRNYYGVSPYLILAPPINVPSDSNSNATLKDFRHQLERWAVGHQGVLVANLNPAFEDDRGRVDPKLFWPDGLTLTTEGYRRLSVALKDVIAPLIGGEAARSREN